MARQGQAERAALDTVAAIVVAALARAASEGPTRVRKSRARSGGAKPAKRAA
jgi:hypothetical protein